MKDKLKQTDLKLALASAKRELKDLLLRAEQLRQWIEVTTKLCAKKGSSPGQSAEAVGEQTRARRTRTAVLAAQVAEVLRASGRPMHVKAIAAELARREQPVTAQNPAATIAVALGRRTDQFVKAGPNTFDLVRKEMKAAG